MHDLKTKRNILKVSGTIRKILESKGYPMSGMKNRDAISIYAKIQFGEEIPPVKTVCEEWVLSRMTIDDIKNPPTILGKKESGTLYRKAVRQIKYYLKDHHVSIVGLDQKQLVRAYAKYRYNESAYEFKEWVMDKIKSNSFKNMPEQFVIRNAKKIRAAKRKDKKIVLNNKEYKVFLNSDYWKGVRQIVISRDKRCCTKCGRSDKLHVHHKTYENHFNEHEHIEDLVTLCADCHKEEHKK